MNNSARDKFISDLMSKMSLEEKIGQMYQINHTGGAVSGPEFEECDTVDLINKGKIGSIMSQYDNNIILELQKKAMEAKNKIPLLFCNDIIHGCRIILPINLAISCSWNPKLLLDATKMVAYEASHSGVQLTFSPMVNLCRDPRWGRVMESNGEDPYLSKVLTKSYIEGYQGKNLSEEGSVGACIKHFVGYGAAFGGRDYDACDMSEVELYNNYLPPYKEAIRDNVAMFMSSFNAYNGVPVVANKEVMVEVLRKKLKYNGVVITDYASPSELIKHKVARNLKDVALLTIKAQNDIEMISTSYSDHLLELVNENEVLESEIDRSCERILKLKYDLGLFSNPYKNIYPDFPKYWLKEENRLIAKRMANESLVLLENDGVLPINKNSNVSYFGPMIDEKKVVGAWGGKADVRDTVTIKEALDKNNICYRYEKGSNIFDNNEDDLEKAYTLAKCSDICVIAVGEEQWMSGESHSRAYLDIPRPQDELIDKLVNANKKIVLIIFSGRPLVLTKYKKLYEEGKINAILYAWFLGTESGNAIYETLYGINNPSGKVTMSFPYDVGQIPVYYNHLRSGRPIEDINNTDYCLRYIDIPLSPLYPFGYGLSYSKFSYGKIEVSNNIITDHTSIDVSVKVKNESEVLGKEVVELYIESLYSPVARPVKELKGFKKITLKPNEEKEVKFTITKDSLAYYVKSKLTKCYGMYKIYLVSDSSKEDYVLVNYSKE